MDVKKTNNRKDLKELTASVLKFENAMDKIMKLSSGEKRGKEIAKALNYLTIANQGALHHGLGYSFKKIEKMYLVNHQPPEVE